MGNTSDEVAPSPGGDSVVSSKRGVSPESGTPGTAGDDGPLRKKKRVGAGSRGVANLTPEQLAKKRENDREAQRNIRRRTKEQIEGLERQIQELTNQQPYQEFLAMKRAKEAVEKENAEIKARLATIIGEVQSLVGSEPGGGRAYASPSHSYQSAPSTAPPPAPLSANNASTPGSAVSAGSTDLPQARTAHGWQPPGSSTPVSVGQHQGGEHAKVLLNQQRNEMRHGLDMGPERLGLGFLLHPSQKVTRIPNGANGAQEAMYYQHVPMRQDWTSDQALRPWTGAASTEPQRFDGYKAHRHQLSGHDYESPQGGGGGAGSSPREPADAVPRHSILVSNCEPTCPLDSLLLDFLMERRQRAAEGQSAQEVIGPRYPSVSSLLNPANSVRSHPLSKVFTDVLSTFPDISTLPERVAVLYIMFLVMRWEISPTRENYELLPEWMRPQPSQLTLAHPAWVDHLPWPSMREKLSNIFRSPDYLFDNFFVPFTRTLRLNWPYEETDSLLQSPDGEELMINPVFERHLRNLDNWSLGEPFARTFPALVETCKIDYSFKGFKPR